MDVYGHRAYVIGDLRTPSVYMRVPIRALRYVFVSVMFRLCVIYIRDIPQMILLSYIRISRFSNVATCHGRYAMSLSLRDGSEAFDWIVRSSDLELVCMLATIVSGCYSFEICLETIDPKHEI